MSAENLENFLAHACPSENVDETIKCHFDDMQINISVDAINRLKNAINKNDQENV